MPERPAAMKLMVVAAVRERTQIRVGGWLGGSHPIMSGERLKFAYTNRAAAEPRDRVRAETAVREP